MFALYLEDLMFGAYIFLLILDKLTSIIINCPLSFLTVFDLKSILLGISVATPAPFQSLFAWSIFFHPFTLKLCMSLDLKQYIVDSI